MILRKLLGSTLGLPVLLGAAIAAAQSSPPPPPPSPDEVTVTVVKQEPPATREETVVETTRPSHDYVWVAGYWDYRPTGWTWVAGHWDRPPTAEAQWLGPTYNRVDQGVEYVPGHWTTQKVITYQNGKKVIVKEKVKVKVK